MRICIHKIKDHFVVQTLENWSTSLACIKHILYVFFKTLKTNHSTDSNEMILKHMVLFFNNLAEILVMFTIDRVLNLMNRQDELKEQATDTKTLRYEYIT